MSDIVYGAYQAKRKDHRSTWHPLIYTEIYYYYLDPKKSPSLKNKWLTTEKSNGSIKSYWGLVIPQEFIKNA